MIRPAEPGDLDAIAAIYNEGIAERVATFETEPRTPADLEPWLEGSLPLLVAVDGAGVVGGWAKLSGYSDRCCYAGVAEISVYVAAAARGRGVARDLVEAVCADAERRGLWKVVGLLFPENEASRRLFAAAGFEDVGTLRRHGRLDGRWRDVLMVERLLGEAASA